MAVPTDITGLRLWLKADAITGKVDTDPIATWPDSSGNGFDIGQATSAKQPLYRTNQLNGLPIVRFDGTDDVLSTGLVPWTNVINTTGGGIYTFMALMNVTSAAAGATATFDDACLATDAGGNTGVAHVRNATTLTVRAYNWDGNEDFAAVTGQSFGSWLRIAQDHDNTTLRINSQAGTFQTVASGAPSASGTTSIGQNYAGAKFLAADVAEIIAWNKVLNGTEYTDMQDYLTAKWLTVPAATARAGVFDTELVPAGWF